MMPDNIFCDCENPLTLKNTDIETIALMGKSSRTFQYFKLSTQYFLTQVFGCLWTSYRGHYQGKNADSSLSVIYSYTNGVH